MRARPVYQYLGRKTPFGRWPVQDWATIAASAGLALPFVLMLPLGIRWQLVLVGVVMTPSIVYAELRDQTDGRPARWLRAKRDGLTRARRGRGGLPAGGRERGHVLAPAPPPAPPRAPSDRSMPPEVF